MLTDTCILRTQTLIVAEHLNLLNNLQGGALWFQNLTEYSHGYSGFIFPFLIAGLHYINVQVMEY